MHETGGFVATYGYWAVLLGVFVTSFYSFRLLYMTWLAITGVVCAVIGAFYYLRIIRAMFFEDADGDGASIHPDSHLRAAFAVNALALLVLGIFGDPLFHWCQAAFAA